MSDSLLETLALHANDRGVVLAREEVLLSETRLEKSRLADAVSKLEQAGLVEVLAPLPFLVLRLRTWPGRDRKPRDSGPPAYSAIQSQQLNSNYRRTTEHWPVDHALLAEILETLGERDGASFEKAVELYSPHVIRTALDRVRRAKGIRKSRTALFRHLLPRLARDEHRFESLT